MYEFNCFPPSKIEISYSLLAKITSVHYLFRDFLLILKSLNEACPPFLIYGFNK